MRCAAACPCTRMCSASASDLRLRASPVGQVCPRELQEALGSLDLGPFHLHALLCCRHASKCMTLLLHGAVHALEHSQSMHTWSGRFTVVCQRAIASLLPHPF